ncbi:MAG: hypothetical protein ABJA76_07615, partial [Mucilaginibacter sp.]
GYTGQVSGKRPWSAAKIILLIVVILAVIACIVMYFKNAGGLSLISTLYPYLWSPQSRCAVGAIGR